MVSRVLVGMDGSEMSVRALEYALDVHESAAITVLFVAGEPSPMMGRALGLVLEDDLEAAAEEVAAEVFERARSVAAERGREIETVVALGNPSRQILDRADGFDAVVVGGHGGDVRSTLFVGNVARTVSNRASVPVTVVR